MISKKMPLDQAREILINALVESIVRNRLKGFSRMSDEDLLECAREANLDESDSDSGEYSQVALAMDVMGSDESRRLARSRLNHRVPSADGDLASLRLEPIFVGNQKVEPVFTIRKRQGPFDHSEVLESLNDRAEIGLTLVNGQRRASVVAQVESGVEAYDALDNEAIVAALMWRSLESLNPAFVDPVIDAYTHPGEGVEQRYGKLDMTMCEMCDHVFGVHAIVVHVNAHSGDDPRMVAVRR